MSCATIQERINNQGEKFYPECARIGTDGKSAFEACPEICQGCNLPFFKQEIPLSTVLIITSAILFCVVFIIVLVGLCRRRTKGAKNQSIQMEFFGGVTG